MITTRRFVLAGGASAALAGCARFSNSIASGPPSSAERPTIETFEPGLSDVVASDGTLETLGVGYQWAEGPAWHDERKVLYFTDVPQNKAYIWRDGAPVEIFLDPSGASTDGVAGFREPGANGLLVGHDGKLMICNHGHRALEAMEIDTGKRDMLANRFEGLRFNSPNDLAEASDGTLYFTDPPYGLEGLDASPLKEMSVNGVYRRHVDGTVERLMDDMTFPNGIALSPDERFLYVSQSDPAAPIIRRMDLSAPHRVETWFDATGYSTDGPGLPDGMAVASTGHVLATGPGGVFVLTPEGHALGRINPGRACANCCFGEDGRTLFITAQDRLMRIRLKLQGAPWG